MTAGKKRMSPAKRFATFLAVAAMALALLAFLLRTVFYPREYQTYVEKYSEEYGIEQSFVYAVINVESGFDENASSDAGAVGLMQIIEDAFQWTKRSLDVRDRDLSYEDMKNPEYNIEYGCCMLGYYYSKYGSYELSAAAYHAGTNQVDIWIAEGSVSGDCFDADEIPSAATAHYVKKVMRAYKAYEELY